MKMYRYRINWLNFAGVLSVHLLALVSIGYLTSHFSPATAILGSTWFLLCHFSISAGYHRLFAHRSYETVAAIRLLYLFFGAASVQNSALTWCAGHRDHHAATDTKNDPYNIREGFWWAHIGWVLFHPPDKETFSPSARLLRDLARDPLIQFQHDYYWALAFVGCIVLPAGLGALWGDPIGAVLIAGFLRLSIQWQITFSLNSLAHSFGSQPYSVSNSARDNLLIALLTFGEGYHNYHHRFPSDYRNGVWWYQYDPTKWFVWCLSRLGLASELKTMPLHTIRRAQLQTGTQNIRHEQTTSLRKR